MQFRIPGAPIPINTGRASSNSNEGMHDRTSSFENYIGAPQLRIPHDWVSNNFLGIYILSYGFAGSSLQQTAMQCGIEYQIPGAPTSVNTARAMSISTGGMHDRNSFLEKPNDVHSCIFCIIEYLVH